MDLLSHATQPGTCSLMLHLLMEIFQRGKRVLFVTSLEPFRLEESSMVI